LRGFLQALVVPRNFPPMFSIRSHPVILFAMAAALALAACASGDRVQILRGSSMGTTWTAQLVVAPARADELRATIEDELDAVIAQMSTWEPASDLSRFNRAPAGSWQTLPAELFDVLDYALTLAHDTGGAYDPTVGPLVDLWGFGSGAAARSEPPSASEISDARARVGFRRIELDRAAHRAKQPGGVTVDVSSLGPGHAIDRIAARLKQAGIEAFLIELGGEMRAEGRKPDGSDWRIAVEPANADEHGEPQYDLVIALRDESAGSSGDYRVGFEHAGRRYSHTIDPRSGEPVQHALAGVTVIADTTMQADAQAAALMVLGPDEGMIFAERRQIAAVFTLRGAQGFERRYSPAFEPYRTP
jgi:thiamine biosynthesis lipoprotein